MNSGINDLVEVTDTLCEQALEAHRRNLAESRRIAQEIEQIDSLRHATRQDDRSLEARRVVGADALWEGWLMRRRADLQREAAMARAYEGESLSKARTAFARAEASKSIQEDQRLKAKQKALLRDADRLDELGTLRQSFR